MVTLVKKQERTIARRVGYVSVVIPAHNEEASIGGVVDAAHQSLAILDVQGEVLVSASGCTDRTADIALDGNARVVEAPIGKGAAIIAGVDAAEGDIVCLVDGDLQYYGEKPLAALLIEPILHGIADATIANLYWRPIYPDQWLSGFFAPLAGYAIPEILPKVGSTPWSGQRAALRSLWPTALPGGFTSDLALILHWNQHAEQMRPVLTDDWYNPIRPKPELLPLDYELLVTHAIDTGRIEPEQRTRLDAWFAHVERLISEYDETSDDPIAYQKRLLESSHRELQRQLRLP
jgi:glucosyl-3-phosphoglycerate synthase